MSGRDNTRPRRLGEDFAHLSDDGDVQPITVDDRFWSETVMRLPPGRLVSAFDSASDWASWEMHPAGDELIFAVSGRFIFHFDDGAATWRERLVAGEFSIAPKGVWHTADVLEAGRLIFVTSGAGTEHRAR